MPDACSGSANAICRGLLLAVAMLAGQDAREIVKRGDVPFTLSQ